MKKLFLYSMMLMTILSVYSCKDDDISEAANRDKLFRPAFRIDNNTGKGSADPYNCTISDLNTAHLYWYTVDDAVAYEIKWAIQNYVANGQEAWEETEAGVSGKELAGHTVVTDPKQFDLTIKNLNYSTDYRFAIRALHSYDPNDDSWKTDPKNSDWYGYGNGREWADYLGMQTGVRYDVPFVIQTSDITKTSMVVRLDRSISKYSDDEKEIFREHFNFEDADQNILKIDYLTFTASKSTPNATTNPTYLHYDIPESAWVDNVAEITVDGLSENSVYNIDVWDNDIDVPVDACYNSVMKMTKGTPGAPILIKHVATAQDTIDKGTSDETYVDISSYNSMKLDNILSNYNSDVTTAENQVFYLEGGKAYHFTENPDLYKGVTFRTNPEDLAQGKRATVYLNGIMKKGADVQACNFMMGRQPNAGENSTITLDIDSIRFMDLDFDVPMATNFGHKTEGTAGALGNYFANMYSNGMGINITLFEMNNCTFQGLIRGFFRIQGSNNFYIQHLKMVDCQVYNCGWYQNNGGGYNHFHADHNGKPKSNILKDVEISGNVFYNSPKGALITDSGRNLNWDESVRWNIDIHNNTFVNFLTPSNSAWLSIKYVPGGSTFKVYSNIWINTKDVNDANRNMGSSGWFIQKIQGGDGTGRVVFDIYNNWTTNDDYLKNGQPFQTYPFNATKDAPGAFVSKWADALDTHYPHGTDELNVHCDTELKATDLMMSPNPTHFVGAAAGSMDFHTDNGIDGLYYKQTDKVFNSEIYKSGAGAPRLRNGK